MAGPGPSASGARRPGRTPPLLALLGTLPLCLATLACRARPPQPPALLARLTLRDPGLYRLDPALLRRAGLGWEGGSPTDFRLYGAGGERRLWPGSEGGWPLYFLAEGASAGDASEGSAGGEQAFLLYPSAPAQPPPPRPEPEPWPGLPRADRSGSVDPAGGPDPAPSADPAASPGPARSSGPSTSRDPAASPQPSTPFAFSPPLPRPAPGSLTAELRLPQRQALAPERATGAGVGPRLTAPEEQELGFDLPSLAEGGAALGLRVWSATEAPAAPDHALALVLNESALPERRWDGAGDRDLWWELPAGALRAGSNRLRLALRPLPEVLVSSVHLAEVWLRYPRPALPAGGRLDWLAPGPALPLDGFSPGALAWAAAPGLPVLGTADAAGGLALPAQTPGLPMAAANLEAARAPLGLERAGRGPDLRHPRAGADWLAVAPPDLLPHLAPLVRRRHAEGLRVALVSSRDIGDQFGVGRLDAAALAAFLDHVLTGWQPAPRYVLLVGDAPDLLPTGRAFGQFGGWVASDMALARDGAGLPRPVALGRLPARDGAGLRAALDKLAQWEGAAAAAAPGSPAPPETVGMVETARTVESAGARDAADDWRRRGLLVADPSEPSFQRDAAAFGAALGSRFRLEGPAAALESPLTQRLDGGLGLTAYFGHGTRTQWGRDRLLDVAGAEALGNAERPGLVLNFSCLTGAFDHPEETSLAEALLLAPGGGAAAVIAPSSLTLAADQAPLAAALARALADPATARLGDALLQARRALPVDQPGAQEVAFTFFLFGDPALRLGGR